MDIPLVDLYAILCALAFPITRSVKCRWNKISFPRSEIFILDLFRGAAFAPFTFFIFGAFSKPFLFIVLDANRLTLFLAGLAGAFSVLKSDKWIMDYVRDYREDIIEHDD